MIWKQPLAQDRGHYWTFGSRMLWTQPCLREVRVFTKGGDDAGADGFESGVMDAAPGPAMRFVHGGHPIVLGARCADRAFVVRPAMKLSLLPGSETPIYVSTPAWLTLSREGREPFFEVPTFMPNSTWFGATPQAGELAYASRSRARSQLDLVDVRPGRITTKLTLINHLDTPWQVERLKVPTRHLSSWYGPQRLWTPSITIRNTSEGETDMGIDAKPPPEAGVCERLGEPRESGTPRLFLRALGTIGWTG